MAIWTPFLQVSYATKLPSAKLLDFGFPLSAFRFALSAVGSENPSALEMILIPFSHTDSALEMILIPDSHTSGMRIRPWTLRLELLWITGLD